MPIQGFAQEPIALDLKEYRWNSRLLVVFAVEEMGPAYQTLLKEVDARREDFDDRDMVLISIFDTGTSMVEGRPITSEAVNQIRNSFNVPNGTSRVFLVGKDGGVKQKGGLEIQIQSLFNLIDTMPMRRSEMRRKTVDG